MAAYACWYIVRLRERVETFIATVNFLSGHYCRRVGIIYSERLGPASAGDGPPKAQLLSGINMRNAVAGVGLLSLVSLNANAADSGFFAEALVGHARQETSASGQQSVSGEDLSIGVRLNYQLHSYLALELSWLDYGKAEDTYRDSFGDTIRDTLESRSFGLGLRGIWPLEAGFSLLGRLGVAHWEYEIERTDSAFPGRKDRVTDDGQDVYYGAGAQYLLSNGFIVGLEYTVLSVDLSLNGQNAENEVSNLALSLGYSF